MIMEYTQESIYDRLSGMVKDLPGCDYYSAGISKRSFSRESYYTVDLAFRLKNQMRAIQEMNDSKEWAVENAFIRLNTIVDGIKTAPVVAKMNNLPRKGPGRPRKQIDTDNSMAA